VVGGHLLPRDVGISRAFNSRAMALADSTPAFRSFRIVEASALARRSAARVCALPILILPFVIRPTRASTLATVVRCHFPPRVVGTLLRFNSFASARWEMKPVAISVRMVGSKASAWAAGRLFAEALLRDAISSPTRSIEPSWPGFATATDVKSVSRSLRAAGHVATYSSVSSEIKRPFLRLTPPPLRGDFSFNRLVCLYLFCPLPLPPLSVPMSECIATDLVDAMRTSDLDITLFALGGCATQAQSEYERMGKAAAKAEANDQACLWQLAASAEYQEVGLLLPPFDGTLPLHRAAEQ
jgi:hypothetical protein